MRHLWLGLGGACGSVGRHAIGLRVDQSHFPWATLGINLSVAFVLGLSLTLTLGQMSVAFMTPAAVGLSHAPERHLGAGAPARRRRGSAPRHREPPSPP